MRLAGQKVSEKTGRARGGRAFGLYVFAPVLVVLLAAVQAEAQIRVSPDGVNVSTQTPVSAFLTFGNLNNQVPAEATWCGELVPAAPAIGLKCNPATIFGVIPARYDRTTPSGLKSYTDIMTLPTSVARRAYQAAVNGAPSSFFFVRRFVSTVGGPDEFVVVACRMTGGAAGSPFSITDVKLDFKGTDKLILFAKGGERLPQINAEISYTGTGRLKGRWEVVKPGEDAPTARDLLTEATLPVEQRGTQRRYTQVSRFNLFLPARGKFTLPGPDPADLPAEVEGEYLVLLRVEATDDDATTSDLAAVGAGPGIVSSGAVAGFPMPVLRYFVGAGSNANLLRQLAPAEGKIFNTGEAVDFAWMEAEKAALYRLEVTNANGKPIFSALLLPGSGTYRAPSWLSERAAGALRWRVMAMDGAGKEVGESEWHNLRFAEALPEGKPGP
ncbi:MAG TPA: hypothetical protein VEV81_02755 [Pyrinomonadaceae bacterium]|nr:hypothetical protein [Pyrinomonadaceae bacterium]